MKKKEKELIKQNCLITVYKLLLFCGAGRLNTSVLCNRATCLQQLPSFFEPVFPQRSTLSSRLAVSAMVKTAISLELIDFATYFCGFK